MSREEFDQYVLPAYTRFPITIVRAEGSYIYDDQGKQYLDFLSGWGVSNLGHRPPSVVEAIKNQAGVLIHVPNVFYTEPQGELAKLLVDNSLRGGKVFFGNSGAEANEAAIKFAKLYGQGKRHTILTAEGSFHGRTAGVMAATAQGKVKGGFDPQLQGFVHVPFNDIAALQQSVDESTLAIMLELVQGEGGINVASVKWLRRLAEQGRTVFITSHVLETVERLCDSVAIITRPGRLLWNGDNTALAQDGSITLDGQEFRALEPLFLHLTGERYADLNWL